MWRLFAVVAAATLFPPSKAKTVSSQPCQCPSGGMGSRILSDSDLCELSQVSLRRDDHNNSGLATEEVTALFGNGVMSQEQREKMVLANIALTSFDCLDDRLTQPSLSTPGGDLGEFILALAAYFRHMDPEHAHPPSQELVDMLFHDYLMTLPGSRPLVHCTDDYAINQIKAALAAENFDLNFPLDDINTTGLFNKLLDVDGQGDSHIRMMLKQPHWYELDGHIVPRVLTSFYTSLWAQNQDKNSSLYRSGKLKLRVLHGVSNPQAFIEVSVNRDCLAHGVAPMLTPHQDGRHPVLVSHLDAVKTRREELADFFVRIANVSPFKTSKAVFFQHVDYFGLVALDVTGAQMAAHLPLYHISYN